MAGRSRLPSNARSQADLAAVRSKIREFERETDALEELVDEIKAQIKESVHHIEMYKEFKAQIAFMERASEGRRVLVEYEDDSYADIIAQVPEMEENIISIERVIECRRAEIASAEERARALAAAINSGSARAGNSGRSGMPNAGSTHSQL